jgi:hypothetical protein
VTEGCEVTIFAESGFIARKSEKEIKVPILEDDDTGNIWRLSDHMVHRYQHPRTYAKVKHWLKVALPEYRPSSPKVHGVRLSSGGQTASASLAEDLNAIAFKNFSKKKSTILLRTAARALAKHTMTAVAEDKNEVLGWLANLFGTATEAADTRGWLALPGEIWVGRITLPPGTHDLLLEFIDARGRVVEEHPFPTLHLRLGEPAFLSHRCFQ